MTLPRVYEIWSAWKDTPPLHQAFMGFMRAFGKEGSKPLGPAAIAATDSGDLLRDLGAAGVGNLGKLDPQLLAMLDATV